MCGAIDELPSSTSPAFQPRAQRTNPAAANENGQTDGIFIPLSGHFSSIFGRKQRKGRKVAIIAPFSNLTIITTNSIPKERDALIVWQIIIGRGRRSLDLYSTICHICLSSLCPNGFFTLREGGPKTSLSEQSLSYTDQDWVAYCPVLRLRANKRRSRRWKAV